MTEAALREDDLGPVVRPGGSGAALAVQPRPVDGAIEPPETTPARKFGSGTFRSLQYRDYRLTWFGTLFSSSGQWIQQITVGWLAYQLTGSPFLLGAINGFRSIPLLFLAPFGGVAADRIDRKLLMLTTNLFLMLTTAVMAVVIFTGQLQMWHLFAFTLLTGVAWAFTMPVRQSIVPKLIPKDDLMNALALNSAGFNMTRILGPSLAGIMIAKLGGGENFTLQALMYVGVTITVAQLRIPEIKQAPQVSVRENLKEGAKYVWTHQRLRVQMTLALVPVLLAFPYMALMPIFAKEVLHSGAGGFGLLMSAPGIGAVVGTLAVASTGNIERKGHLLLATLITVGATLIMFSMSRNFVLSFMLLVVNGGAQMVFMTTNQTLLQLTIPEELRGRVMGIYLLNQGLMPLGSLFAGTLASLLGAPMAVTIMGSSVMVLAALFVLKSDSIRNS